MLGPMSQLGQKRRFDPLPTISGLLRTADIMKPARWVRFVPTTEMVNLIRWQLIRPPQIPTPKTEHHPL